MLRAALTGGIATGKSFCLRRFGLLGIPVVDADVLAREAVAPGSPGLAAVVSRFGAMVLGVDGALDRGFLGRIVFSDRAARADLEAIIHPIVYRAVQEFFAHLPVGTRLAIADIPLLFETGREHEYDRVIVCSCPAGEQIRRLGVRDQLTPMEAMARLNAQWPVEDKVARADYVIRTDRSVIETEQQVSIIHQALLAET
jgi:dephospho-CoA kinase